MKDFLVLYPTWTWASKASNGTALKMKKAGTYKSLLGMVKSRMKIISFKMASTGAVELLLQHN